MEAYSQPLHHITYTADGTIRGDRSPLFTKEHARANVSKDHHYYIGGNQERLNSKWYNPKPYCEDGKTFIGVTRNYTGSDTSDVQSTLARFAAMIDHGRPWHCVWKQERAPSSHPGDSITWRGQCKTIEPEERYFAFTEGHIDSTNLHESGIRRALRSTVWRRLLWRN